MNKKYLMKGLTALALIVGFTSCVKDVEGITPAEEAEKEKENAEINLGLKIPEGQTWEMAKQEFEKTVVRPLVVERYGSEAFYTWAINDFNLGVCEVTIQ